MSSPNPFTVLPIGACDNLALPAFSACQDGTAYVQRFSEVCGIIVLPQGAPLPTNWTTLAGWEGIIDNEDLTGTKARYLVGIGDYIQTDKIVADLASGRNLNNDERTYTLSLDVLQMHPGHALFGLQLQANKRDFSVWIETVGHRLIGGPTGLYPKLADAIFDLVRGNQSREIMGVEMIFKLPNFPLTTLLSFAFTPTGPVDPEVIDPGGDGGSVWGDPTVPEIWGNGDEWDAS